MCGGPLTEQLETAKERIRRHLESVRGGVFTEADLSSMLAEYGPKWGLTKRISLRTFTSFLVEDLGLRKVDLRAEHYRRIDRFAWREFSPYLMALSLRPRSYLSHGTAVFLHGLTDQLPKTIYANQEQSEKPRSGDLSQERLTLAFQRRQRTSNYIYSFDGFRAVLLSGKQTGSLGVAEIKGPQREELPVTGLARTLIDIVVRPAYAGGIIQVIEAYRGARGKISGAEIVGVLGHLDYIYPYHQAIGFVMERAGYSSSDLGELKRLGTHYDFYLLYGMRNPERDEKWRLFFPEGL